MCITKSLDVISIAAFLGAGWLQLQGSSPAFAHISGDTVWYEGVEETLEGFPNIHVAVLFVGAARIPVLPANLTFSAAEAVRVSETLPNARIVPAHFEGWKHLTESKEGLTNTVAAAGRKDRLLWLPVGQTVSLSTFKAD